LVDHGFPQFNDWCLMQMRLLDQGRLLDHWWVVLIDGTLQDRGHDTPEGQARYRYVVEAKLAGPDGLEIHLMTEFVNVLDPVRDKEDCELNAFLRLARRLKKEFPRLPICLVFDSLYPIQSVFHLCQDHGWRFIATLKEGRQPEAWDEAVATTRMSPLSTLQVLRQGEHGPVSQTLRWTQKVPFDGHLLQVLFAGEISPVAATLWCWVTNFSLDPHRVCAIANQGGRSRQRIETVFNVEKYGGFGLEHAFCANPTASQNYHLMMQTAFSLGQLLAKGVLRRLIKGCRKVSDVKLSTLLRTTLLAVAPWTFPSPFAQLRFDSSA